MKPRKPLDYKPTPDPKPRNRANEAIIIDAIRQKVTITFRYRPTDMVDRVVEPHALWVTEAENACLFCVQVVSETGLGENAPKNLDPYQMSNIRLTGELFEVDPAFKRDRYSNVLAMVSR